MLIKKSSEAFDVDISWIHYLLCLDYISGKDKFLRPLWVFTLLEDPLSVSFLFGTALNFDAFILTEDSLSMP